MGASLEAMYSVHAHVKVMLAYGHSLSLDHQGVRNSVLIIEKQQGQWGQQQPAFRSIVIIKQCLHELSRRRPRRSRNLMEVTD